jgi:hypothetical protein
LFHSALAGSLTFFSSSIAAAQFFSAILLRAGVNLSLAGAVSAANEAPAASDSYRAAMRRKARFIGVSGSGPRLSQSISRRAAHRAVEAARP